MPAAGRGHHVAHARVAAHGRRNKNQCQVANLPGKVGAVRLTEAAQHRWGGRFGGNGSARGSDAASVDSIGR
jgi:hypothetical protein